MGRPRNAKHPKPAQQAALEKTAPDPEPVKTFPSVSKAEAVRQAVAAGAEMPSEGVAYVLKHFGIEMDNKTFSLNKSQQKVRDAKREGDAKPELAVEAGKPIEGYLASPEKKERSAGEPDVLTALENVKELVEQFGAEKVKRMVDLLG